MFSTIQKHGIPLLVMIFDMSLFKNLILILCLFSINAKGQTNCYKTLLDSAIKFTGPLFVGANPIAKIRLEEKDIRENYDDLKDLCKEADSTILFQIIRNSKKIDTVSWADTELDKFILIQNRDQDVQLKYIVRKFNLTDKKKIRYYRKQINQFNLVDASDRNIFYYSRPVFDDSKQFAIIQWDNGHSWLDGGGGIKLYKLTGDTWKEVGIVARWQY
jgi:hypothetical protein